MPISLRRALNTPVLSIPELSVGPATAIIATHASSASGAARYTLAVRSERTREVALFPIGGARTSAAESALGADAALSLAESMGFLFEEGAPAITGKAAESIWQELVDAVDPSAFEEAPDAAPLLSKFRRATSIRSPLGARVLSGLCAVVLLAGAGCATSGADAEQALRLRRASSHLNLGLDYVRNDRVALGLRELLTAERFDPKDPRIQQALGDAYAMRGKPAEAEQHYLRSLELAPDFHEARFNLAALYNRLQRYDEAIEHCAVLADDATFAGPWRALAHKGFAELRLGRVDEARRSLQLALEYRPDYWPALLNLGILEMEEGQQLDAISRFQQVLGEEPGLEVQAQANYRIGEIYVALGERDRAVSHLRAAVAQAPGGPWGAKSEQYLKQLR